jgi:hypothetical protein
MATSKIESASLASDAVDNTNIDSTLITAQTEKTSLVDADKFLISDSADSNALKYVQKSNLPAGSWTLLEDDTVSSAVGGLVINSFSSTYKTHAVVFDKVRPSSNDDTIRHCTQLADDSFIQGYTAGAVDIVTEAGSVSTDSFSQVATGYNKLADGIGNGSNEGFSGIVYYDSGLTNASDALLYWGHIVTFRHNDTYALSRVYGRFANADIDRIQYGFNTGNIASGSFKLYGIGG